MPKDTFGVGWHQDETPVKQSDLRAIAQQVTHVNGHSCFRSALIIDTHAGHGMNPPEVGGYGSAMIFQEELELYTEKYGKRAKLFCCEKNKITREQLRLNLGSKRREVPFFLGSDCSSDKSIQEIQMVAKYMPQPCLGMIYFDANGTFPFHIMNNFFVGEYAKKFQYMDIVAHISATSFKRAAATSLEHEAQLITLQNIDKELPFKDNWFLGELESRLPKRTGWQHAMIIGTNNKNPKVFQSLKRNRYPLHSPKGQEVLRRFFFKQGELFDEL